MMYRKKVHNPKCAGKAYFPPSVPLQIKKQEHYLVGVHIQGWNCWFVRYGNDKTLILGTVEHFPKVVAPISREYYSSYPTSFLMLVTFLKLLLFWDIPVWFDFAFS